MENCKLKALYLFPNLAIDAKLKTKFEKKFYHK